MINTLVLQMGSSGGVFDLALTLCKYDLEIVIYLSCCV